jgi:hypothetical protein
LLLFTEICRNIFSSFLFLHCFCLETTITDI